MKIIALIDHERQPEVVERILRHRGLWLESEPRAPPVSPAAIRELTCDLGYFDKECA